MKKYFLYELKKHLWTLIILTAACTLPYIVNMATSTMWYEYEDWETGILQKVIQAPNLSFVYGALLILLFIVPMLMYSFKMSKRGVDGYYSLPLKKEKLYFVLTMVGLILVIVPYTVAYWSGFLALLFREGNPYQMEYFVPAYFVGVLFAVFLYGINAFLFTRANRTSDGVIFMLAYAIVGYLFICLIDSFLPPGEYIPYGIEASFFFSGGMFEYASKICRAITGGVADYEYAGWWFGLPIGAGIVSYGLLFYLLRFEKGENAEQTSESWFGYRTIIPVYMALSLGSGMGTDPLGIILIVIAALIATMVHKHTFRLKWKDLLPLACGLVVGLVLMIFAL